MCVCMCDILCRQQMGAVTQLQRGGADVRQQQPWQLRQHAATPSLPAAGAHQTLARAHQQRGHGRGRRPRSDAGHARGQIPSERCHTAIARRRRSAPARPEGGAAASYGACGTGHSHSDGWGVHSVSAAVHCPDSGHGTGHVG